MPTSTKRRKTEDPENRFWTRERLLKAKPIGEMPASLQRLAASQKRDREKASAKVATSIHLSQDVLEALQATGPDWQSRADDALRKWIQSSKRAKAA